MNNFRTTFSNPIEIRLKSIQNHHRELVLVFFSGVENEFMENFTVLKRRFLILNSYFILFQKKEIVDFIFILKVDLILIAIRN